MPNTGKPSRGCHLCRARRVKCDLAQPSCLKCGKLGKICPGYRQELDLWFRNESAASFAKKHVIDQRKDQPHVDGSLKGGSHRPSSLGNPKSVPPAQIVAVTDPSSALLDDAQQIALLNAGTSYLKGQQRIRQSTPFIKSDNHGRAPLTSFFNVPASLHDNWESHSTALILSHFARNDKGSSSYGYLHILPDLSGKTKQDSCLNLVTNAVASTYLVNQKQLSATSGNNGGHAYGRALKSTIRAIQDPSKVIQDETMLAVLLLGIHEILVDYPKNQITMYGDPGTWHVHMGGLTNILRLRGIGQFATKGGRDAFWIVYNTVQVHCLGENIECPKESLKWLDIMQAYSPKVDEPHYMVASYAYKVCYIRPRVAKLVASASSSSDITLSIMSALIVEVDDLEAEMRTLMCSEAILPSQDPRDVIFLHVWNMYRSTRIKLHHSLFELFNSLEKSSICPPLDASFLQQKRQTSIQTIREMADEIIHTIPYAVGDPERLDIDAQLTRPRSWSDALRIVWSLRMIVLSSLCLPSQKQAVVAALRRIKYGMGIRKAVV